MAHTGPMTQGHFLWTDLSTYDMRAAQADYAALFGWRFQNDATYDFATLSGKEVAAVFPMPDRLAKMEMPSFWMSYIHVPDLDAAVAQARTHEGVIIEVEPQAFSKDARVALVRDPSGAGFTLYEGPEIASPSGAPGQVTGRTHHLPDISLIEPFYRDLFGWRFQKTTDTPWPRYDIRHPDGTCVAIAEEVPEAIRGKYRYWMPSFTTADPKTTLSTLETLGGAHLSDLTEGRHLIADRQGAHFIIAPAEANSLTATAPTTAPPAAPFAWKALLGLACIWLAVVLDLQAFWGVLFLIWTWPAIRSGQTHFVEPVSRSGQPFTYWALIGTWVLLSLWLILAPFFPTE